MERRYREERERGDIGRYREEFKKRINREEIQREEMGRRDGEEIQRGDRERRYREEIQRGIQKRESTEREILIRDETCIQRSHVHINQPSRQEEPSRKWCSIEMVFR